MSKRKLAIGVVTAVVASLLVSVGAAPAFAASTILVGPTRAITSIQGGIDAAVNGDTVIVDAGTYVQNIIIKEKYITLQASGAVTVRAESGSTNAVLQVLNAPTSGAGKNVISGFTFTGGAGQPGQGGGITISGSSPEIKNCVIDGNRATAGYGGGILIFKNPAGQLSNPFIHDNTIQNNSAADGGGGIFAAGGSAPIIVRNNILSNSANGPWDGDSGGGPTGGGIYLLNEPGNPSSYVQPVVLGNTINNNTAAFAGGAILIGTGINVIVEDNTIDGNSAPYGGGIHIESVTSQPIIDSNRITNNRALVSGAYPNAGQGGAIAVYNQSRPTVSNNTISGNVSSKGGGAISSAESANWTLTGNVISNNSTGASAANADGGGLYIANSTVVAQNNLFQSNSSDNGSALVALASATVDFVHNTVVKNQSGDAQSGAIYVGDSATRVRVANNLLYGNGKFQIFEPIVTPSPKATITNNLIGNNVSSVTDSVGLYFSYLTHNLDTASGINNSASVNASGNVVGDPLFTNFAGNDFTLQSGSPAIGAAVGTGVESVANDIRGVVRSNPRDSGAYEYAASPVYAAAPVLSGTAQVGLTLTSTAGSWGPAPGTVSYEWFAGGTVVGGASGSTFVPRDADIGKQVFARVTVTKYGVYTRSADTGSSAAVVADPNSGPLTLRVGSGEAFATIQAAVDAARNGDTVLVTPGTYVENVAIAGKYITVTAPSGATIRAASGTSATVTITALPYVPGKALKLTGFTITGGDTGVGVGGGLRIDQNATPEVYGNTIEGNSTTGFGGGITIQGGSSPIIRANTIQNNDAALGGGGIYVTNGSNPVIFGNQVLTNTASGAGGSGGGIFLENTADPAARSFPVVLKNTISGNTATVAGGGVLSNTGANTILEKNEIVNNTAAFGGGVQVESTGAQVALNGNHISGNTATIDGATSGSGSGGGVSLVDKSNVTLRTNLIENNTAGLTGGGVWAADLANVGMLANTIRGNAAGLTTAGTQNGGGLTVANATVVANNNLMRANSSDQGGAIALVGAGSSRIFNNTIVGNVEATAEGGAILVKDVSGLGARIADNIITGNQGYQVVEELARATINRNIITAPSGASTNGMGVYFSPAAGGLATSALLNTTVTNANTNDDRDPVFVDAANGNFAIGSTSPAIDLADTTGLPALTTDIRGAIRNKTQVDVGAYEYLATPIIPKPIYRFWSDTNKGHFFTASEGERDTVASTFPPAQFRYEAIAYNAFGTRVTGSVPIYRFYSSLYQGHFYTASEAEKTQTQLNAAWSYEGVAYYVYPMGTTEQSKIVYRFWSPDNKHHFWTASQAESDSIQATYPTNVWTYDGKAFRVPQ